MQNYDFSEEIKARFDEFSNQFKGDETSGWQTALKILLGGILVGVVINWLIKMTSKEEEKDTYTTGFPLLQTTKAPVHGVMATRTSPFEPASVCTF
jgi:hypothetical protein